MFFIFPPTARNDCSFQGKLLSNALQPAMSSHYTCTSLQLESLSFPSSSAQTYQKQPALELTTLRILLHLLLFPRKHLKSISVPSSPAPPHCSLSPLLATFLASHL